MAAVQSKDGLKVEVWQNKAFNWLCVGDETIQSVISRQYSYKLVSLLYQHMAAAVLLTHQPRSILFLGLGGGDLSRFFYHYWPQINQEGVEINSEVIEVAKTYFSLPPRLKVHHQNAIEFVSLVPNIQKDLIFVDLFSGSQMSKHSIDLTFLAQCYQCLTPHGVMVINISFPDEKHYINGLFQIRQISKKTLFLSVPDYNNLLVFILGQHIPVCTSATLLNNATCLEQQCHLDFAELADRLIKQNQNFFKRSLS